MVWIKRQRVPGLQNGATSSTYPAHCGLQIVYRWFCKSWFCEVDLMKVDLVKVDSIELISRKLTSRAHPVLSWTLHSHIVLDPSFSDGNCVRAWLVTSGRGGLLNISYHLTNATWYQPTRNLTVEDIVVIKGNNIMSTKWSLGKVVKPIPEKTIWFVLPPWAWPLVFSRDQSPN